MIDNLVSINNDNSAGRLDWRAGYVSLLAVVLVPQLQSSLKWDQNTILELFRDKLLGDLVLVSVSILILGVIFDRLSRLSHVSVLSHVFVLRHASVS